MAGWAPSAEGLAQLLGLFRTSHSANNAQHRAIQQQLTEFNVVPDYNNYLAHILNHMREEAGEGGVLVRTTTKGKKGRTLVSSSGLM